MPQQSGPASGAYYTVKEFATLLRVSKMTVYRAVEDGEVTAIRMRKRILIPATALADLTENAATNDADDLPNFNS